MASRDGVQFTLLASTAVSSSSAGTAVTGLLGLTDIYCQVNCSAVPTGGTPTLDVYLQTSADAGTTWRDIAHKQFTTSTLKVFWQVAGDAAGATASLAASDAALAGDTVVQGPWGDRLRIKYAFAAGGSSGSYTLAVNAYLK